MEVPSGVRFLVIGAGVHGLSTAWHLALELKKSGKGSGADILVVDKTGVGAGASGIACGVIRNNYFQPAMRRLMAQCVEVWESDPKAFSYHPVGYMQISPEAMHAGVASIAAQQKEIGYESTFIEGAAESDKYMKGIFSDWQARGITSVLHEKKGGYANNMESMKGLAAKAESEGVRFLTAAVTGFKRAGEAVDAVVTDHGTIKVEAVVVAAGPWAPRFWTMLDLPRTVTIKGRDGKTHDGVKMWTYWCLEEGTLGVDPKHGLTNDGKMPPVIHVDTDAPLHSDVDGRLLLDKLWGLYYKPDFSFNGVQGGSVPYRVDLEPEAVAVDPYGPKSREFVAGPTFPETWVSMLAHCQARYHGTLPKYRKENSGGLGAFTPDSFPVFDLFRKNCYVIADSNHGYKMIGVGKLVAGELLGRTSELLEPFRFSRYAEGKLHPVSTSPFPWS